MMTIKPSKVKTRHSASSDRDQRSLVIFKSSKVERKHSPEANCNRCCRHLGWTPLPPFQAIPARDMQHRQHHSLFMDEDQKVSRDMMRSLCQHRRDLARVVLYVFIASSSVDLLIAPNPSIRLRADGARPPRESDPCSPPSPPLGYLLRIERASSSIHSRFTNNVQRAHPTSPDTLLLPYL